MIVALVAGFGVGLALMGMAAGLRPVHRSALSVLEALAPRRRVLSQPIGRRPDRVLGARLAATLEARGWLPERMGTACRAAQTSVEEVLAEALLGGILGLTIPAAAAALAAAAGIAMPMALPAWAALALGAVGACLPFYALRASAMRARRAARTVMAAYLDLVVLCLAGGMGIEGALHAAARIADDEFSGRIGAALDLARDAGHTPWEALADLGEDVGVGELSELAAAVRLAGTEGAKIRSTLSVKAASIRRHELADAEAAANAVTERLFLPGSLLLVGFLLFLGYPAIARITGGG